jgi:hypothetical protein
MPGPLQTSQTIHGLKQEINNLTTLQTEALQKAVFVGMTPDEAKEYDERRTRISKYIRDLKVLQESL